MTSIGSFAFYGCSNLTSVTNLSLQPQAIKSNTFSQYGRLHVLQGCKDNYGKAEYWKNFTIEEDAVEPKPQCAIPTIEIINGNVKLSCDTKGAKFNYTYTYSCSASGTDSEFSINSPTVTIVASANADGYEESEMAIKTFRHNGNGDVNGDGKVTMEDVNIILNTYLGK